MDARGYCRTHYSRWRKGQDVAAPVQGYGHTNSNPTYTGAHARPRLLWGRARQHDCISCGLQAEQWSYDHTDPTELAQMRKDQAGVETSMTYSAWPEFYAPMCKQCHLDFDRRQNVAQVT